MKTVKIMVVPGKIAKVEIVDGGTVLDACHQAEEQIPGVGWEGLAKDREVRVQNQKFSNTEDMSDGFYGNIYTTALSDGDVILILTKIKGNGAVITCWVDGAEFALETPVETKTVLAEAAGINLADVESIRINNEEVELSRLVAEGDEISVVYRQSKIETMAVDSDVLAPARDYITGLETTVEALQSQLSELKNAESTPIAIFGHLGGQLEIIELEGDETVQDILDENRDLGEYEVVFYNGRPLDEDDLDEVYVQAGDSILIVPTTKNGRRVKFLIDEE